MDPGCRLSRGSSGVTREGKCAPSFTSAISSPLVTPAKGVSPRAGVHGGARRRRSNDWRRPMDGSRLKAGMTVFGAALSSLEFLRAELHVGGFISSRHPGQGARVSETREPGSSHKLGLCLPLDTRVSPHSGSPKYDNVGKAAGGTAPPLVTPEEPRERRHPGSSHKPEPRLPLDPRLSPHSGSPKDYSHWCRTVRATARQFRA